MKFFWLIYSTIIVLSTPTKATDLIHSPSDGSRDSIELPPEAPSTLATHFVKKKTGRSNFRCLPFQSNHLLNPSHAMSFEVDSALVGVIHGSDLQATLMTSIASSFSLGSFAFGLYNIVQSSSNSKKAKEIQRYIQTKIESLRKKIEDISSDPEIALDNDTIEQEIEFYVEINRKIYTYLQDEKQAEYFNSVLCLGTFSEFLGFLGSEAMLGHSDLYPKIVEPAKYFLTIGLSVVSISSLWEATESLRTLIKQNNKLIVRELQEVQSVIDSSAQKHSERLEQEQEALVKFSAGGSLKETLSNQYNEVLAQRLSQHYRSNILKVLNSSETLYICLLVITPQNTQQSESILIIL